MARLIEWMSEFQLAADFAWNEYRAILSLEQWAACRGLAAQTTARLRTYMEAEGIL